jgi:hypothetical protein
MGNRYNKRLELNGIVVGDYLGSDEPEEDIQAARQRLKDLGLYNPPTTIQAMRGHAQAFAAAANLFYKQTHERGPGEPPILFTPFVVNAAFSVELYLKTLLRAAKTPTRGHSLVSLHAALASADQDNLQRLCAEHTQAYDPGTTETLAERIAPIDRSFERWRYVYEFERAGMVSPRSLILVMKACHEATMRIAG